MDNSVLLFGGFIGFVLAMLALDLGVFNRKAHVIGMREAVLWSVVWTVMALLFGGGVYLWMGHAEGLEFITGYVVERALSMDNIFVFMAIFSEFALPIQLRHRALLYGILGALILRAGFIATGVTLINTFHWVVYPLGAFLIFTGFRLARQSQQESKLEENPFVRLARRVLPVTSDYQGTKFFVRDSGVWMITPLFLVVLVVEVNDVAFALDSVPAVLAITQDPFIVFTSNVFAILGLRALYFVIAGALLSLRFLGVGIAAILALVGIRMMTSSHFEIPVVWSLGLVLLILVGTIAASLIWKAEYQEKDEELISAQ
ncbi:MAG: TerC/Alx family metal homeostasis membrane protein [Chloroflexi bacterium]|nr:TerC/Alx family metal homeostasis membrane protein [Chloroflexota bacterium]